MFWLRESLFLLTSSVAVFSISLGRQSTAAPFNTVCNRVVNGTSNSFPTSPFVYFDYAVLNQVKITCIGLCSKMVPKVATWLHRQRHHLLFYCTDPHWSSYNADYSSSSIYSNIWSKKTKLN
ncbi:unnamed protein product [Caenorhabditis auriculariae]|uniref:Secreted protein n=1 Tax=Caenorhabditis auriculariae TaxID=2777116 RepID=A0A8S1HTQ3_9PELO|nr:unnamed protein product [Caenorhabditis auriculariae]